MYSKERIQKVNELHQEIARLKTNIRNHQKDIQTWRKWFQNKTGYASFRDLPVLLPLHVQHWADTAVAVIREHQHIIARDNRELLRVTCLMHYYQHLEKIDNLEHGPQRTKQWYAFVQWSIRANPYFDAPNEHVLIW